MTISLEIPIPPRILSPVWTPAMIEGLRELYSRPLKIGELAAFAKEIQKHPTNVSRKARGFGWTVNHRSYGRQNPNKFATKQEASEHLSRLAKERWMRHGHPKGFKGHKHTDAARAKMAAASQNYYLNATKTQRRETTMKMLKTRLAKHGTLVTNPRPTASWKAGWRTICGKKKYYRSRWEFNYALYLQFLKDTGNIQDWAHEPETFWFEGIRRGVCSYLPDFKVTENNGAVVFHEVKGWMDARSATKLKRMKKYHPAVKLVLIQADFFRKNRHILRTIQGFEDGKI